MIINSMNGILDFANSDLVAGLANISQFYNIYQSTKAGTYAQLNHDMDKQTDILERDLDKQTQQILEEVVKEIRKSHIQNDKIIKQNEDIISLLDRIEGMIR